MLTRVFYIYNAPKFKNVLINSEPYFVQVLKGTNGRMPFSFTGVFEDVVPGSPFAGTWNVISTVAPAPEVFGYETIGQAVVTFNGDLYVDTTFELFNYPCVGNPSFTPQMGDTTGNPNTILAHAQSSNFNGPTSWDLATEAATYFDNTCSVISSETFTWTNLAGTITKDGLIFID